MSAGVQRLGASERRARSVPSSAREPARSVSRSWVRLATFAALSLYGVVRWATLLHPAPVGRLLGLGLLAVVLAGAGPLLERTSRWLAGAAALAAVLAAFPAAGLPWQLFVHVSIAVSAGHIGDGLQALPGTLVPYIGSSHAVRLVILLGAAVLLLDAAIVTALAGSSAGDGRRAGAALPLIALAGVPSTLLRPELPYLQGLLLFGLIAAFMWGDRVRRGGTGAAIAVAALAGVAGAIAAPALDRHTPWVNYRAWAGTVHRQHLDSFNWNQTYGPLHWPRTGREVLTVRAAQGDYWKAEDLDQFNGYGWSQAAPVGQQPPLPNPAPSALARWSQRVQVTIQGMTSTAVIAAGAAAAPTSIPGGALPGVSAGTWTTARPLAPGTSYEVRTYSPSPSGTQLASAGSGYPDALLTSFRTLTIPYPQVPAGQFPTVVFPPFHSRLAPYANMQGDSFGPNTVKLVEGSPYGGAYALARQLATIAPTPYAFARSVERFLSRGYSYNESPPARRYPLESFLFADRIGYCQQFSGAMALLLRMGGIPARVAAGFTSGSFNNQSHTWTVTDTDAHAWVEAWFPHFGFVRFDPTPASAPARGSQIALPFQKPVPGASPAIPRAPRKSFPGDAQPTTSGRHAPAHGSSPLLIALAGLLVLTAVGLIGMILRAASTSDELLTELERALTRSGRVLEPGLTLAALEQRFRSAPAASAYVRCIRLARYGGESQPPTPAQRRALREQLRLGLGLSGRLRALWALPPRPALGVKRRRL